MSWEIIIAVWVSCAVIAYRAFRGHFLRTFHSWTLGDRCMGLALACGMGPVALLVAVLWCATEQVDLSRPAKW